MTDDLKRKAPEDPNYVNTSQSWEVDYWCKKFNCTNSELKSAVDAVGTSVSAVQKYLNNN